MNVVAFSLYGFEAKYIEGALANARLINKFLPLWKAVFYVGDEIPQIITNQLRDEKAIVRFHGADWHSNGMFWRFQAFNEPTFDYILIRDVDSRMSSREVKLIDQWLKSGKSGHIIRDHPLHNSLMMGGMWGAKRSSLDKLQIWNEARNFNNDRGQDQYFLNCYVYPILVKDSLVHDSFFNFERFSERIFEKRKSGEFIGEVIDANGNPDVTSRNYLLTFENSRFRMQCLRNRSRYISIKYSFLRSLRSMVKNILRIFSRNV